MAAGHFINPDPAQYIMDQCLAEYVRIQKILNTEAFYISGLNPSVIKVFRSLQQSFITLNGKRLKKIISLSVQAPHFQEHLNLFSGFHTLCYNTQSHERCHPDNGLEYSQPLIRTLFIHIQKLHINFQDIDINIFQHIQ